MTKIDDAMAPSTEAEIKEHQAFDKWSLSELRHSHKHDKDFSRIAHCCFWSV